MDARTVSLEENNWNRIIGSNLGSWRITNEAISVLVPYARTVFHLCETLRRRRIRSVRPKTKKKQCLRRRNVHAPRHYPVRWLFASYFRRVDFFSSLKILPKLIAIDKIETVLKMNSLFLSLPHFPFSLTPCAKRNSRMLHTVCSFGVLLRRNARCTFSVLSGLHLQARSKQLKLRA